MQALPSIEQEHTRNPSARRIIRRQAVHTMAAESTRLRMVANIPARPIPITETAIIRTGGLPTATAFTSLPEKIARAAVPSGEVAAVRASFRTYMEISVAG
jgi:hypothetical protein